MTSSNLLRLQKDLRFIFFSSSGTDWIAAAVAGEAPAAVLGMRGIISPRAARCSPGNFTAPSSWRPA